MPMVKATYAKSVARTVFLMKADTPGTVFVFVGVACH